jgi:hypothetical protein
VLGYTPPFDGALTLLCASGSGGAAHWTPRQVGGGVSMQQAS